MDHFYISLISFLVLIVGIHIGRNIPGLFPKADVDIETKEAIKRGLAFLTTLTALVLGLLVSTGKASFDKQSEAVAEMISEAATLDEMLSHYGADADQALKSFRIGANTVLLSLWDKSYAEQQRQFEKAKRKTNEDFLDLVANLPKDTEQHQFFKEKAGSSATSLIKARYKLATLQHSVIPIPMLVTIVLWLTCIFMSLGFCSPKNTTALMSEYVGALCAAAAILLITELDNPFTGVIQISKEPAAMALRAIGAP